MKNRNEYEGSSAVTIMGMMMKCNDVVAKGGWTSESNNTAG